MQNLNYQWQTVVTLYWKCLKCYTSGISKTALEGNMQGFQFSHSIFYHHHQNNHTCRTEFIRYAPLSKYLWLNILNILLALLSRRPWFAHVGLLSPSFLSQSPREATQIYPCDTWVSSFVKRVFNGKTEYQPQSMGSNRRHSSSIFSFWNLFQRPDTSSHPSSRL